MKKRRASDLYVGKILTREERKKLETEGTNRTECTVRCEGAWCQRNGGHKGKHCWWRNVTEPEGRIEKIW